MEVAQSHVEVLLCQTDEPLDACKIIQDWGCDEVMITRVDGVYLRCGQDDYFERFTPKSLAGRTGRGDTTFGAYLGARVGFDPADALKLAASLVSLKMETPGPFGGMLDDVMSKARTDYDLQ